MIPDVTSKENEKILGDKPAALHITQVSALQYTWQVLGGDHILHKQNSEKVSLQLKKSAREGREFRYYDQICLLKLKQHSYDISVWN